MSVDYSESRCPKEVQVTTTVKVDGDQTDSPSQVNAEFREAIVSEIKDGFLLEDKVNQTINERIKSQIQANQQLFQEAEKAFENFLPSKIPSEIREEITYLSPGDDLKFAQSEIIKEDIAKAIEIGAHHGSIFSLSDSELKDFGIIIGDNGSIARIEEPEKLLGAFNSRLPLSEIIYPDFLQMAICKMEELADASLEEIRSQHKPIESGNSNQSTSDSSESPNGNVSELKTEDIIDEKVALQMEHMTSPEMNLIYGLPTKRATQVEVAEVTKNFALSSGPADVPAFHDFFDLQIAFRHIWTELFDGKLRQAGIKAYEELVKIKEIEQDQNKEQPITSAQELKELIYDLHRTRYQIAGEDPRLKEIQKKDPQLTVERWASLSEAAKDTLFKYYVTNYTSQVPASGSGGDGIGFYRPSGLQEDPSIDLEEQVQSLEIERRTENFLEELEDRLQEKYSFDVFAKNSINFGILVNYRQNWNPITYQVGELVSTIPLAPKETRRYSKKRVIKKSRAVKEIENSLQIHKEESADTARDHYEIVRRANNRTNFKHNAEGGVNFVVWNAKGSHSIEVDAARQSAETKKGFRESVIKAAQEYKNERRLDIATTSAEEFTETSSGEITNPNDEIPVTYLFYELQRRYEISEKIHKITPVILVANEVPTPDEIDEDWLLAHDWILKRVILDDSYLLALDYLSENYVGDELEIQVLRSNWETQLGVVQKISQVVSSHQTLLTEAQAAMVKTIDEYAGSLYKEGEGLLESAFEGIFGGEEDDVSETNRVKMEAAKEAFERAERKEKELRGRLESTVVALESATQKYATAVKDQFNRRTEILRLRAHVKDNILYYMQAIWDQEPPDQRFFRLYNLEVDDFSEFEIQDVSIANPKLGLSQNQGNPLAIKVVPKIPTNKKKLVEVADLDNLLGYKGNYMIFPLKKNNSITMFMMQDYLDISEEARLRDPDELRSYSLDELKRILACIYKKNPDMFERNKEEFRNLLIRRLTDPYPDKEEIVVPTDSLYIEALPGKHPVLEDFKLVHRAVDVKKAQADVRHDELENVRLAARVSMGQYEDPDIDKEIVIRGEMNQSTISTNVES